MDKQQINKYRQQVGRMLQQHREAQGWDVVQVAQIADLKPATVEKIEVGAFNVPLDVLSRVADVLGCKLTIQEK